MDPVKYALKNLTFVMILYFKEFCVYRIVARANFLPPDGLDKSDLLVGKIKW